MEFDFSCKECGSNLSADETMTGMLLNCPSCNSEIEVPSSNKWSKDIIPTLRPPSNQRKKQNNDTLKSEKANRGTDRKAFKNIPRSSNSNYTNKSKKGNGVFITILFLLIVDGVGFYFFNMDKKVSVKLPQPVKTTTKEPTKPAEQIKTQIVPIEKQEEVVPKKPKQQKYDFIPTDTPEIENTGNDVAKVEYGYMNIEANLFLNKTVKVHYAIPYGKNGKPLPSASNVVYICPFRPERKFFTKEHFKWFPEKGGYTCFSMDIESDPNYNKETEKFDYVYVTSGFPDLVFKVKEIIEDHFGLEKRNILLTGQSAGTCMSQEMVEHFPDKIDAFAGNGGYNNIKIKVKNSGKLKTAFLINNTVGDWYSQKPKDNPHLQVLRRITPAIWKNKNQNHYHHTASSKSWNLIHLLIKGVIELRAKHNGVLPYYNEWSYKSVNKKGKVFYFPSLEFKKAWDEIPEDILDDLKYNPKKMAKENIYFSPPAPSSVVIYIHSKPPAKKPRKPKIYISDDGTITVEEIKPDKSSPLTLQDNLYYLYMQNAAASSVMITENRKESMKRVVKLLKEVMKKEEWKHLPIYVCGVGIGGEMAAVAALRYGEKIEKKRIEIKKNNVKFYKTKIIRHQRVKKIIAINAPFDNKKSYLSIKKARSKSHIPLVMLYGVDFKKLKPKNIPDYTKIITIPRNGYTLGKEWFHVMKRIAAGGNGSQD